MKMENGEQNKPLESDRWLQERHRSGNWFDIAIDDEIPSNIEGPLRTILHMSQVAFVPEIRQRLSSGQLDDNFILTAAQLIQQEEQDRIVRLNNEVRGLVMVRVTRPVEEGESALDSDMQNFLGFDLEEDELDAGHFTMFWTGTRWVASFDFRNGRAKCTAILETAIEFWVAAQSAATRGHARACVDTLFTACEQVAKAQIILHHLFVGKSKKPKKHGSVQRVINKWGHLGNINPSFLILYNQLSKDRSPARYNQSAQVELPTQSDIQLVGDEIEILKQQIAQRIKQ